MKQVKFLVFSFGVISGLVACDNNATRLKTDTERLSSYVDSVSNVTRVYTTQKWATIDNGYKLRIEKVESHPGEFPETEKEKLAETKTKFEKLKADYEVNIRAAEMPDARQVLRNSLFGEGRVGKDMQFGFVNANNLLSVYTNFVNTVAAKQNGYSREDWDEIKVLYEALDTRKNEVEKELDSKDNTQIAKLKVKFSTIKTIKRPFAKVKENEDAKN